MTAVLHNEIKTLVRKTVKEVLRAELARLRGNALPFVSEKEMADIVRRHKKPMHRAARTIRIAL